jgi:hypothetical protein
MSLNPRAIATQGLGFSTRHVAVQGLWPVSTPDVPTGGGGRKTPRAPTRFNDDDEIMLLIASVVASGLLN